ncbi:carbon storage regulator CsrA [Paenibacillus sp. DXFW5]|uniref:Translational regulator CsrA n=1 Tax=Paenibacillus rhizolycopersici TaxID=2780073 RepID=A0ABS2HA74_9BACL|nr:carbon storage regulator CsrA [Paenibacillus rhizolycopersici]MBM6997273.1 carbon storage regulator CsrA [Paenibacillus rhizolycopersici]
MLVLTRKKGESIIIAEDIEITVLAIDGENVKIGVKAPKQVNIHRKEIYLAIQESNKEASSGKQELLRKITGWNDGAKNNF